MNLAGKLLDTLEKFGHPQIGRTFSSKRSRKLSFMRAKACRPKQRCSATAAGRKQHEIASPHLKPPHSCRPAHQRAFCSEFTSHPATCPRAEAVVQHARQRGVVHPWAMRAVPTASQNRGGRWWAAPGGVVHQRTVPRPTR